MTSTHDLIRFLSVAAALLIVAGLVIALTVGRNCSRSASQAAIADEIRDIPPTFNLTASQLVRAYKDDEESATATYNGKAGIVESPALLVEQSNYLRFFAGKVWAVRCFLSDEHMEKVKAVYDSSDKVYLGGDYAFRIGAGSPTSFSSLPVLALKGKVEGVNNKILTIDIHGCTLHDSQ